MENIMNGKINLGGLPSWHRKPATDGMSPFEAMMAPPSLPLPTASYQAVWKKPYFMNHSGAMARNGRTDTYLKPSDGDIAPVSSDDQYKLILNPSQPSDNYPISIATAAKGLSVDTDDLVKDVTQIRSARALDPNMDPKKLQRIVSNRISAQKSRLKKLQYISDMEGHVKTLEDEITVLSPQVAFHQNQNKYLKMEKNFLNQRLSTCADDKIFKEAQIEENQAELNRLRQLYMTLQQQMPGQTTMPDWESGVEQTANLSVNQSGQELMTCMNSNQGGMEQMMNFNSFNLNPYNGLT